MWTDPIVEEVRKHRREIEEEYNGDLSLLFARAKEIQKTLKERVVSNAQNQEQRSTPK